MRRYSGKGLGKTEENYTLYVWDSPYEQAKASLEMALKHETARQRKRQAFNYCNSLDEAVDLTVNGWHAVRQRVDGHLEPIREKLGKVLDQHTERYYDISGYEPCVDRYLAGEVDCMIDDLPIETPHDGKVFTIIVDNSMSWSNDVEDILKRGAAIIALVESFILLGYQLEVWVEATVKGDGQGYLSSLTKICDAGERLDIDTMMMPLGNPDYQRRVVWGTWEGCKEGPEFGFPGYCGMHMNGIHFQERVGASACLFLGDRLADKDMIKDPVGWVLGQLEDQGVYSSEV